MFELNNMVRQTWNIIERIYRTKWKSKTINQYWRFFFTKASEGIKLQKPVGISPLHSYEMLCASSKYRASVRIHVLVFVFCALFLQTNPANN